MFRFCWQVSQFLVHDIHDAYNFPKRSQITTVTVTQYAATNPTTVVVVGGNVATTTYPVQYNGYCSTLVVQNQPGLPTTRGGYPCGTILVVGDASRRGVGRDIAIGLCLFYASLGVVWGFLGRGRWWIIYWTIWCQVSYYFVFNYLYIPFRIRHLISAIMIAQRELISQPLHNFLSLIHLVPRTAHTWILGSRDSWVLRLGRQTKPYIVVLSYLVVAYSRFFFYNLPIHTALG